MPPSQSKDTTTQEEVEAELAADPRFTEIPADADAPTEITVGKMLRPSSYADREDEVKMLVAQGWYEPDARRAVALKHGEIPERID